MLKLQELHNSFLDHVVFNFKYFMSNIYSDFLKNEFIDSIAFLALLFFFSLHCISVVVKRISYGLSL